MFRSVSMAALIWCVAPSVAAQTPDEHLTAMNAQFAAQDWSDFIPFWFSEEDPGAASVTIDFRTKVFVLRGAVVVQFQDTMSSAYTPASAFPLPEQEAFAYRVTAPIAEIEVSEIVEDTHLRRGEVGTPLADIAADPAAFKVVKTTSYGFKLICRSGDKCMKTALASGPSGLSLILSGTHDDPVEEAHLMAPTRSEAEELRSRMIALLEALRSE